MRGAVPPPGSAGGRAAGVERVILAPTGTDWQRDYEFAAEVSAAYR
ncbi:hypothetical protein [Promicromonospora umidemergens]|nr:hypothetical protein [Promicromonospora umidemergens]